MTHFFFRSIVFALCQWKYFVPHKIAYQHVIRKNKHTVFGCRQKYVIVDSVYHAFFHPRCLLSLRSLFSFYFRWFLSCDFIFGIFFFVVLWLERFGLSRRRASEQHIWKKKKIKWPKKWQNYKTCHEIHKYLLTSVPLSFLHINMTCSAIPCPVSPLLVLTCLTFTIAPNNSRVHKKCNQIKSIRLNFCEV